MKFFTQVSVFLLIIFTQGALTAQRSCTDPSTGSATYDVGDGNGAVTTINNLVPAGTVVEICFSVDNQFQTPDQEWIHSIRLVDAGPGFDLGTIGPSGTPPASCLPAGVWAWYPSWTRCANARCPGEPSTFFNGYAFDSSQGVSATCGGSNTRDGDPGNNYGDGDGSCGLVFCFSLTTVDATGFTPIEAYQINILVRPDGTTGGWRGNQLGNCSPCDQDPAICFPEIEDPIVDILNEPCPGGLFNLVGGPATGVYPIGVEGVWRDSGGNVVATGFSAFLPAGTYTFEVSQPGCAPKDFVIEAELPLIEFTFDGPDDGTILCFDEDFAYSVQVTGTSINTISWELDGNFVGSNATYAVTGATPSDSGTYSVTVNYGDNCDSTLSRMITILPEIQVEITPIDEEVCSGNDITFMVTAPGGIPLDPTLTISWDGGASTDATYTLTAGDPGPAEVNLMITDSEGCLFEFDHPYLVNELPEITIDPIDAEICFGTSLTINSTVTAGEPPFTYLWGPDEIVTTPTLTIAPPYPTLEAIYLEVTDNNGCVNFSNFADVRLITPPARPSVSCEALCPTELLFSWPVATADYYELYANINNTGEVLIDNDYRDNTYLFAGLNPDDRVTLRVVPFGGDPNGDNCGGPDDRATCRTPLTYSPGWSFNYPQTICQTSTLNSFEIGVQTDETGTFTFNSATLGLNDLPADADGMTTIPLPPLGAGQNSVTHDILVNYEGVGGRCPADTTIAVTIVRAPNPAFALNRLEVCATTATFFATLDEGPDPQGTYELSLTDPTVGTVAEVGGGTWSVSITEFGTHELVMISSNTLAPGCEDTARATVTLNEPPGAPLLECADRGLDSVSFFWSDTGADSYQINEIDIPGYATTERIGNRFIVRNLMVNDAITISITGLTAGCPDASSAAVTCVAESCPEIVIVADSLGPFCADLDMSFDLTTTITGSDGSGTLTWTIDGVPTAPSINPATLGEGTYILRAQIEEGCVFFSETTLIISPIPTVTFTLQDDQNCVGETTTGAAAGAVNPNWTYTFTAPGAQITAGANAASRTFSWDTPGLKFVSLTIENEFACTSETYLDSILVTEPLELPVIDCIDPAQNTITFSWSTESRIDSFGISLNGGPIFFQDSTTLFLDGLTIDSLVLMELFVFGQTTCPPTSPILGACRTSACPSLSLTPPAPLTFCLTTDTIPVELMATVAGASEAGTFLFSGAGVQDNSGSFSFSPLLAGGGTHRIYVDYVETNCAARDSFDYTVIPTPPNTFRLDGQLNDLSICERDTFLVAFDSTGLGAGTATFEWDFGSLVVIEAIDFENYRVRAPGPGTYPISLTTTVDGCSSLQNTMSVLADPVLPPPVVSCGVSTLSTVTFTWPPVAGAEGYQLGDGTILPATQTSFEVIDLVPGEDATITLIALSSNACGNSMPSNATTCTANDCPAITITPPADQSFCLGSNTTMSVDLSATQSGSLGVGTFEFTGPGVQDNGNGNFVFDPVGVGAGVYNLTVNYTAGNCTATSTFRYSVFDTPTSDFTLNGGSSDISVCVGERFEVAYTGTLQQGDGGIFDWEFSDATEVANTAFEMYTLFFDAPGTYPIELATSANGCDGALFSLSVIVTPPLPAPVVSCTEQTFNSLTFSWAAVPNATGYLISDGTTLASDELTYTITGLTFGEEVTIDVTALSDGPCGNSNASSSVSCTTRTCPDLVLAADNLTTEICLLNGNETIDLSTVIVTGGSGVNASYVFNGPGVTGTTFDASSAGGSEAGITHTITLLYTEEGPCTLTENLTITVFERPSVFITQPEPACTNDEVRVLISSTNFVSNQDITVDWDGGVVQDDGNPDDGSYNIVWDTPGTKIITASVTSNISGCPSLPVTQVVEIIAPLLAPALACGPADQENLSFTWMPVPGATGYSVILSTGEVATLDSGTTEYLVSNLLPGTSLTAMVTALGDGPCGNSPEAQLSCSTAPCPGASVVATTEDQDICLDGLEASFPLLAVLSDGSAADPISWSGIGVVMQGPMAVFDPTGLSAGTYVVYVDYDGPSICDSRDSVTVILRDLPFAEIGPAPTQACAGEPVSILLNEDADPTVTYVWDFDGGQVTDQGNETYQVIWATPGIKTISLTATDACTAGSQISIDITPTLGAPVPVCVRQDLDGVLFEWPAVGAASQGYQVSVNDGPFGDVQTETSFLVTGLDFGEMASISVRSVRSGTTCDLSVASTTVSCAARLCPEVSFAPAAAQTNFCEDETTPVRLNANLSGDDGSGALTWSGPGVVANADGTFSFDPVLAGLGPHTLRVDYVQETLCDYSSELRMEVFSIPSSGFVVEQTLICTGTTTIARLVGNPDPDAIYNWSFDNGTVADNGEETYEISFNDAGPHNLMLEVTRNGCTSTFQQSIMVESPPDAGSILQGEIERCAGTSELIDLSASLQGADPGGVWTVITGGGIANGSLDEATGQLSPAGLRAGAYQFVYTVSGGTCPDASATVDLGLLPAPVADAGMPQTLTCNMGMVSLNGNNSETGEGYTYRWTSDDPNLMIMDADQLMVDVGQPGVYQIEVTNAIGCSATDEVIVDAETEAPVMEVELSQITCFQADDGAILITGVNGGRPPYRFTINGEERGTSTLFAGLAPQAYDIQVIDANGCFSNIILDLTEPEELTITLRFPGDSTLVDAGEEIFISASINGGNPIDTLLWQPDSLKTVGGSTGIEFIARESQMISVTVVDELGCTATDREMLLVRKNRPVYFPTAFSPNGDNINDIWFIGGDLDEIVSIQDFFIYDRWGEAVHTAGQTGTPVSSPTGGLQDGSTFLPNDPSFGWDGRLNGEIMNPQVLIYTARVNFRDGESIVYKGDFVLMR